MPYTPTIWKNGDIITSSKLNKIEEGVAAATAGGQGVVRQYANKSAMALDASLTVGDACQTMGYFNSGDGGASLYRIEEEPYLWGSVLLTNGFYANLVDHERVSAVALGFKSDGTDNGPVLEALMVTKRIHANLYIPLTIVFPPGDFVFSPVQCDTCGLNIEGYGTPNTRTGCVTRFLPAGDQEYILKFGRDNVLRFGPNGSQFMYRGNSIKRIRFSTLKYGQDDGVSEVKAGNWWTLSKAALIIGRLTMSKFEDLFFWQVVGTAISITASYEISFYNTYMYHIVCIENGALNFAEDIGNQQQGWASDNSALYFDYIAFEGVAGDCVTFDRLCDTYNTMFGIIDYEDYRTSSNFGTVWTDSTFLPEGYEEPDVELAIFHFKERCTTDQTIVSQLQWQQPSTRSFIYDGVCYAKTTLMKVDGYVYDASLSVGILDVRTFSSRGATKTILSPSPYTGDRVNLYIGKVINNSSTDVRPEGYVRTYEAHFEHTNSRNHGFDVKRMAKYYSVYDSTVVPEYVEYFEREEIQTYSPYSTKMVGICPALGKASAEAYSYNGICALPPLPSVLPNSGNMFGASPIRIVITGEILKIRAYLPAYDELICQIRSCDDNSTLKTFNLRDYQDTGWQWLTFDLSQYKGLGYLTFAMRPDSTSEPLLDVYYFEQKVAAVEPDLPDIYEDVNVLRELDVIHDNSHTGTEHGVSFEYSEETNTVTATGTATDGAALFYVSFDALDPGVYYINANITQSDTHRLLLWDITEGTQALDTTGQKFRSLYADETNEFVVQSGHEYIMMFRVDEGKTVNGVTFTPTIYALEETVRRKGVYKDVALDVYTNMVTEGESQGTSSTSIIKEIDAIGDGTITQTINDVTFTFTDGVLTATGTASAAINLHIPLKYLAAGTYYASGDITPAGSMSTYRMSVYDNNAAAQARDSVGASFKPILAGEISEFVIESRTTYDLVVHVDSGSVLDGVTFSPKVYVTYSSVTDKGTINNRAITRVTGDDNIPDSLADAGVLKVVDVFSDDDPQTETWDGVTFSFANGVVTLSGTATQYTTFTHIFGQLSGGVHYAAGNFTPMGSTTTYRMIVVDHTANATAKDSGGTNFASVFADELGEFVAVDGNEYGFVVVINEGVNVDGVTFAPVIYEKTGSTIVKKSNKGKTLSIVDWIPEVQAPEVLPPVEPTETYDTTNVLEAMDVLAETDSSLTENGVAFTYNATTHVVTATGTATAAALFYVTIGNLDPGTYYIDANVTPAGSLSTYRMLMWDIDTGTQALDTTGAKFKSVVADETNEFVVVEGHSYVLMFRVDSGVTVDGITFSPVIYSKSGSIAHKGAYNSVALDEYDWIPKMPEIPHIPSQTTVLSKINVFSGETAATDTIQDVTFVTSPGDVFTVTANGTCSSEGQAVRFLAIDNLPVGTYLAGINVSGGGNNTYNAYIWDTTAGARAKDSHNEEFRSLYGNELNEFVVEEKTTGRYVMGLRVAKNATVSNLVFRPVIFSIDGVIGLT